MAPPDRPVGASERPWWLAVVWLSTFVLAAGNGLVFGLMADLRAAHDLSRSDLALVASAVFLSGLVAQLLLAGIADRGHAKVLLMAGLAGTSLSLLWFAVADQLWHFVMARALEGLSAGAFMPAARAMVAGHQPRRAGHHLGRLSAFEIGGFVLGPAIGSITAGIWGLSTPFVLLAVPTTLAFAVMLRSGALPERHAEPGVWWRTSGLDLLRLRPVVTAALLAGLLFFPVGIYDALWDQYLTDLGASPMFTGLSLTAYGIPIVLLSGRGGRIADRMGPLRAGLMSLVVIVPTVVAYGVMPTYWLVGAMAMIEAVAQSVAGPATHAAMALACPPDRLAAGQGLAGSVGLASAGIAAAIGPVVYDHLGSGVTFGGAAAVMSALGLAVARLGRASLATPQPRTVTA